MRYKSFLVCLALVSIAILPKAALAAPGARPAGTTIERQMLWIINHDRRAAGLPSLRFANRLSHVALAHSMDMAAHSYFSHFSSGGMSPFDRIRAGGIHYHVAGENLGWHTDPLTTGVLQTLETEMLASPEHRANLLRSSFQKAGIGIAVVGDRFYLTEDFEG